MKKIKPQVLVAGVVLGSLLSVASVSFAQKRRPFSGPLDTQRGIYIRPDGTRVRKSPAPPRRSVYTFRTKSGRVVTRYGGARGTTYKRTTRRASRRR